MAASPGSSLILPGHALRGGTDARMDFIVPTP